MPAAAAAKGKPEDERLGSWKEIASYLGRSVRTVQRWEKDNALPVRRVALSQRGAVYASRRELDEWWASRSAALQSEGEETGRNTEQLAPSFTAPGIAARSRSSSHLTLAGILACFVLVALIGVVVRLGNRGPALLNGIAVITRTGLNEHPVLSPDGKQVAYLWGADRADIYVQILGDDVGQPVTTSHLAFSAAWAPDGKRLAYLQWGGTQSSSELWVLNWVDGERRHICDIHIENEVFPRGRLLTWSRDGASILVTNRPGLEAQAGLVAVSVADGHMQPLTSPQNLAWKDICPRISPDGRVLAFLREQTFNRLQLCYVPFNEAKTEAPTCLLLPQERIYGFTFGPDSRTVFASLADAGLEGHIWRVHLRSAPRAVRVPLADATTLEPDYSGGKLIYVAGSIRVALRQYQVSSGPAAQDFKVLAASNNIEICPQLSPDGRRLAFVSNRSGAYDVWVVDSEGNSDPRRVSRLDGQTAGNIVWSPDGRELAFSETVAGKTAVYVTALNGTPPRRLELQEATPYVLRAWSRDGAHLYVETGRRTGLTRLVQIDLTNNQRKVLVTGPAGSGLGIAADESAFLQSNPDEIKSIDARTGRTAVLVRGAWTDFSVDDSGILLSRPKAPGQTSCISRFSYENRRLTDIGPCTCDGPGVALSKNGKALICSAGQLNTELKYAATD